MYNHTYRHFHIFPKYYPYTIYPMAYRINTYRFMICLFLCLFLLLDASGQRRPQQGPSDIITFDTILIPTDTENQVRLDMTYRVMNNFFIFTRSSAPTSNVPYTGRMEISVEIFDAEGIPRGRHFEQRELRSAVATREFPDIDYTEGVFSFELQPGEYRLLIQLKDVNSERRYIDRDRRVIIPEQKNNEIALYDIFFVEEISKEEDVLALQLLNFGGNIFFGTNIYTALSYRTQSDKDDKTKITASLSRLNQENGSREELYTETISPEHIHTAGHIDATLAEDAVRYYIQRSDTNNIHFALYSLHGDRLEEGTYSLRVAIEGETAQAEKSKIFRVIWVDKPSSLQNIDFAIEMLEYILSPEEYRQLRRGSRRERHRNFIQYWKARDPEPERPFNPVKTEFYRRVDYAAREFSTVREQNGARTDRGKIYILYGPPTNTQRELIPDQAPQETWEYRHLNQRFIFIDQTRQGNYRLVSREEL
jgi:GWxTD domain-containing protein